MISDSIRSARVPGVIGSIVFLIVFIFGFIEMVSLFEFRSVELFDYGSDRKSQLRDQWLGRFFVRLLLVIGNGALLYKVFYP